MDLDEHALYELGRRLVTAGYRFTTVTPETHRRVIARDGPLDGGGEKNRSSRTLRDIFGWSLPFASDDLDPELRALAMAAGVLAETPEGLRSRVRFSSLGEQLFAHSAYPTLDADAVFFGPDTYRFSGLLSRHARPCHRAVDIGCGSGAGGAAVAHLADSVVLADISPKALAFSRANAALNELRNIEVTESNVLGGVAGEIDLVIANPPYLVDPSARLYRDGGGELGLGLALRIVGESMERLARGGRLILYTGTPVIAGEDMFRASVRRCIPPHARVSYEELDPDVFGEELDRPAYARVERLAVVALVVTLP